MRPKMDIEKLAGLLREWQEKKGRPPGYKDMLRLFGYRSKQSVHAALERMVAAGHVQKEGRHIVIPRTGGLKLLGVVPAGFPSPAEEELQDTIDLNNFIVERPEATFMVKVTGDSMIDAGIMPNDIVFVEKGITPKSGDVVIARVDGESTIKHFYKDKDGVRLEPANKRYPTIRPKERFELLGIVRSVVRKYR